MTKVIFISYIDFKKSSAAAARVGMYQKMLDYEDVSYQLFSVDDHVTQNKSKLIQFLNANKYIRYLSYPLRFFLYVLSLNQFISLNDNKNQATFYLYPTTNPLLDYYVVFYLKGLRHQRIICEINELRRFGPNIKEKSFSYYKYFYHEQLSKYYDGLVCISTNIENYYKRYNPNTLKVPILCETDFIFEAKCDYKKGEVFQIGFTGSVDIQKENLDTFFSALKLLQSKGYKFNLNLYGIVSNIIKLKTLVELHNLNECIFYHGVIDQKKVKKILHKQDLLVLPRKENNQNKYGFSTKLSEYMTSGVPILVTNVSDNMIYLKNKRDCLLADAENDNNFANAIEHLINNYESTAKALTIHSFETAKQHFDYKLHAKKFVSFLCLRKMVQIENNTIH